MGRVADRPVVGAEVAAVRPAQVADQDPRRARVVGRVVAHDPRVRANEPVGPPAPPPAVRLVALDRVPADPVPALRREHHAALQRARLGHADGDRAGASRSRGGAVGRSARRATPASEGRQQRFEHQRRDPCSSTPGYGAAAARSIPGLAFRRVPERPPIPRCGPHALSVAYGERWALRDVDVELAAGDAGGDRAERRRQVDAAAGARDAAAPDRGDGRGARLRAAPGGVEAARADRLPRPLGAALPRPRARRRTSRFHARLFGLAGRGRGADRRAARAGRARASRRDAGRRDVGRDGPAARGLPGGPARAGAAGPRRAARQPRPGRRGDGRAAARPGARPDPRARHPRRRRGARRLRPRPRARPRRQRRLRAPTRPTVDPERARCDLLRRARWPR